MSGNSPDKTAVTRYVMDMLNNDAAWMAEAKPADEHVLQYVLASDYDSLHSRLIAAEQERDNALRRAEEFREQAEKDSALAVCNETLRRENAALRARVRRMTEALSEISAGARKFLADTSRPGYQSSSVAVVQAESVAEICADIADAALTRNTKQESAAQSASDAEGGGE